MNKKTIIAAASAAGVLLLGATIVLVMFLGTNVKVGYAENNYGNTMNSSFYYFNGTNSKKVTFNEGDRVILTYSIELKKGDLQMTMKDQKGKEVMNESDGSGEITFTAEKTQTYLIEITAAKAKGKYKLTWTP